MSDRHAAAAHRSWTPERHPAHVDAIRAGKQAAHLSPEARARIGAAVRAHWADPATRDAHRAACVAGIRTSAARRRSGPLRPCPPSRPDSIVSARGWRSDRQTPALSRRPTSRPP